MQGLVLLGAQWGGGRGLIQACHILNIISEKHFLMVLGSCTVENGQGLSKYVSMKFEVQYYAKYQ